MTSSSLFNRIYECLMATEPSDKIALVNSCYRDLIAAKLELKSNAPVKRIDVPGRPERPDLVDPRQVPKRSMSSAEGRVILAHAIAHIEFNAINLALDAVYRFRDMPEQYYADWMRVAKEEAYHYSLVSDYLLAHGAAYGDFEAHNGLWEMALKTDSDVVARMALVPRVLEARGLDVTPGMIKKLDHAGDNALVQCLKIIHQEEVGHVAIGSRWFRFSCEQRGIDPRETFIGLLKKHVRNAVKGPFDEVSRMEAGFTEQELNDLKLLEAELDG